MVYLFLYPQDCPVLGIPTSYRSITNIKMTLTRSALEVADAAKATTKGRFKYGLNRLKKFMEAHDRLSVMGCIDISVRSLLRMKRWKNQIDLHW